MVLGVTSHAPSAGYPQQGYAHKEDYYMKDNYNNSSSMQMMRPHSNMHSPSGPNHHGNGGYPHTNGYGNTSYSSGMHSQHGSGTSGYGNHHSSHMSMGPSRPQDVSYGYQSHGHNSSSPYYQQQHNGSHGWISKDLDD